MTFDHVGQYLEIQYATNESLMELSTIFRTLGRFALPLFVFMIVEGVLHTKNFKRYMLRLGILASLVSTVFIVLEYSPAFSDFSSLLRAGNIFIDLILAALAVYFIKHPNIKIKFLTLLPLAFSVLCFVVKGIEFSQNIDIHWFPCFITMQYDFLTILLALGFYFAYKASDLYIAYIGGYDKSVWESNGNYRLLVNVFSVIIATIVHIFFYLFKYIWPAGIYFDIDVQVYAIFSGAFILFYSGKRGYNAKWFQYGSYLYYPLHILLLAIIMIIQNGGI